MLLWHSHSTLQIRMPVAGPEPKRRGHYRVTCHTITEAMRSTYPPESTETIDDAACGVALLLATDILEARYLRRAVEGDGFDFFFKPKGAGDAMDPFKDDIGIEVSGIARASATNTVRRRAAQKAKQARSRWNLAQTYAIVVEFSNPLTQIVAA